MDFFIFNKCLPCTVLFPAIVSIDIVRGCSVLLVCLLKVFCLLGAGVGSWTLCVILPNNIGVADIDVVLLLLLLLLLYQYALIIVTVLEFCIRYFFIRVFTHLATPLPPPFT